MAHRGSHVLEAFASGALNPADLLHFPARYSPVLVNQGLMDKALRLALSGVKAHGKPGLQKHKRPDLQPIRARGACGGDPDRTAGWTI